MRVKCTKAREILLFLFSISTISCSSQELAIKETLQKDMVVVPKGKFTMGCSYWTDISCAFFPDEKKHVVYLKEFTIDKYEVTFERYLKCVEAGACTPPAPGGACNYGRPNIANKPVNCASWYQAKAFCEWEGKRLPSEAEWEKAARGTDKRMFPWGNNKPTCEYAVMDKENAGNLGCGTGDVFEVGSKPKGASPYGAMDMAGNLWEWTNDWYGVEYYNESPAENPTGPAEGEYKTTRGGDFFSRTKYELRTTVRFPHEPSDYSIAIGFRCAK